MSNSTLPPDEVNRLSDLKALNILDTPPSENFDRLTRIASRVFSVPVSLVSFIDEDRQWFKSREGLDIKETPRNVAFCNHTILGDKVLVITDATKDERFANNPFVLNSPNIRFYAGCPLRLPSGSKVGTLCILDSKPRSLSGTDLQSLSDLALIAESELAALQLATEDDLTGISNRRGFMITAQRALNYCRRHKAAASLVYMDLDNFKSINDRFGHHEGDKVLIKVAELISGAVRDSDLVARLGGDEFVVLLLNCSKRGAQVILSKLQTGLSAYHREISRDYTIELSHGIVEHDHKSHDGVSDLLAAGDLLMYEDKARRGLPVLRSHA